MLPGDMDEDEETGMEQLLENFNLTPGAHEKSLKFDIIKTLEKAVYRWISDISISRGVVGSAEAVPYGSYALEVDTPGSDMDIIVIGPTFATLKEDFLEKLRDHIANLSEITKLQTITGAKVPLIKFIIRGTSVDLCYMRVQLPTIPNKEDIEFFTLEPQDECGKLSLSSLLLNDALSRMIPANALGKRFRSGAKLIKFWAKRKNLYGNMICYMGGVHWMVLFACIFRLHPQASLISLLTLFFETYSEWQWPQPVLFDDSVECESGWEDLLMPIQKPGSTTFLQSNIRQATMRRISYELSLASSIIKGCDSIHELSLPSCPLFDRFNYGKAYDCFLKIRLSIVGRNDQVALEDWTGFVQSRFPDLMNKLEAMDIMCDPTLTEYSDERSTVLNKVYLWGVITEGVGKLSEEKQQLILSNVAKPWKRNLCKYGCKDGRFRLSFVLADRFEKYIPI